MKKLLLIQIFIMCFLFSNAQIADGSVAPNFTATDIAMGIPIVYNPI